MPIPPFLVDGLRIECIGNTRDQLVFGEGVEHLNAHAANGWSVKAVAACSAAGPSRLGAHAQGVRATRSAKRKRLPPFRR